LEAYTDNFQPADYDRITFCGKFFDLWPLADKVNKGVAKRDKDMANYNNRARVFFHEATHLDYFVNAPKSVPFTTEATIALIYEGEKVKDHAYGPMRAKILQNYRTSRGGFFTQRNGMCLRVAS
jgi:hypothetical protein